MRQLLSEMFCRRKYRRVHLDSSKRGNLTSEGGYEPSLSGGETEDGSWEKGEFPGQKGEKSLAKTFLLGGEIVKRSLCTTIKSTKKKNEKNNIEYLRFAKRENNRVTVLREKKQKGNRKTVFVHLIVGRPPGEDLKKLNGVGGGAKEAGEYIFSGNKGGEGARINEQGFTGKPLDNDQLGYAKGRGGETQKVCYKKPTEV